MHTHSCVYTRFEGANINMLVLLSNPDTLRFCRYDMPKCLRKSDNRVCTGMYCIFVASRHQRQGARRRKLKHHYMCSCGPEK